MGSHVKDNDTETRSLPVKLNDSELLERGDGVAAAELKIEELKIVRVQLNADIREQVLIRARLCHIIDKGEENRDIACTWTGDYAHNVWHLHRDDTGEVIDRRPMVAADRQAEMFGIDGEGGGGRDGDDGSVVPPTAEELAALGASGGGEPLPPPTPIASRRKRKSTEPQPNA